MRTSGRPGYATKSPKLKRTSRIDRLRVAALASGAAASRRGLTLFEQVIVLLVMGILLSVFASLIASTDLFQSETDQAETLSGQFWFCRSKAIKSNITVRFVFDLNEDSYRAYYIDRDQEEPTEVELVEPTDLPMRGIQVQGGARVTEGPVLISFLPDGVADQVAVFLGEDDEEIQATVVLSRYLNEAHIFEGEHEMDLSQSWEHEFER